MTYHSYSKWTFDDEVTDGIIAEVVGGLKYHKRHNRGVQYTPDAYIKMCDMDGCIHYIGRILDAQAEGVDVDVERLIAKSPESAKEVVRRVLETMTIRKDAKKTP